MMEGLEKLEEKISTHSLINPLFYKTWSCGQVLED